MRVGFTKSQENDKVSVLQFEGYPFWVDVLLEIQVSHNQSPKCRLPTIGGFPPFCSLGCWGGLLNSLSDDSDGQASKPGIANYQPELCIIADIALFMICPLGWDGVCFCFFLFGISNSGSIVSMDTTFDRGNPFVS